MLKNINDNTDSCKLPRNCASQEHRNDSFRFLKVCSHLVCFSLYWTLSYEATAAHRGALTIHQVLHPLPSFIHGLSQACVFECLSHLSGVLHLSWQRLQNIILVHGCGCPVDEGPHGLQTTHPQIDSKAWMKDGLRGGEKRKTFTENRIYLLFASNYNC